MTKPPSGGPKKAAAPRMQVSTPNADVNSSSPNKSTWERGFQMSSLLRSSFLFQLLTSMEDVTAGQAEREKPNRIETARKVGKE